MSPVTERRQERRYERGDMELALSLNGRELADQDVSVLDISEHGFGLHIGGPVAQGSSIRFKLGIAGGSVSGEGDVRWVSESGGGFRCGVSTCAVGVLDRYRLRRYLTPGHTSRSWGVFDRILTAAALGVSILALASYAGWDIASLRDIIGFYLK